MDRFGEKAVYGPCVLMRASLQCYRGSLWRGGSVRESRVSLSEVTVIWWLALEKTVSGVCVLEGEKSQLLRSNVYLARFGEKDVPVRLRS